VPAPTLVIANLASRGGLWRQRWPVLERELGDALGPLDVRLARDGDDVAQLATAGVRAGAELVIVAGGDGTVSRAASGLLSAGLGTQTELAVLPLGTGQDFARTLGVPRDPARAVAAIATAPSVTIDAGRVSYRASGGRDAQAHFINVASAGLSGRVTGYINRHMGWVKRRSGRLAFFLASLRCLVGWRPVRIALCADGEWVFEGAVEVVAVANGNWFGGGMAIAPNARLEDRRLDIVTIGAAGRIRLLSRITPSLYRGRHLGLEEVSRFRVSRVELRAAGSNPDRDAPAIPLEVDGEPLGHLPASFEIVPAALRVRRPVP